MAAAAQRARVELAAEVEPALRRALDAALHRELAAAMRRELGRRLRDEVFDDLAFNACPCPALEQTWAGGSSLPPPRCLCRMFYNEKVAALLLPIDTSLCELLCRLHTVLPWRGGHHPTPRLKA